MRRFTPAEVNRLLPQIRTRMEQVRNVLERMRFVRDQLTDLGIVWGTRIHLPDCPDHREYQDFHVEFSELDAQLRTHLDELGRLGCEVKDPDAGLVDFYAQRGEETVFLCWKVGEPAVAYWHTLEGGFASRQPLAMF